MSDFGLGAINNTIGWGQGASNNTIGWGAIHGISWSPSTDLVGVPQIVLDFIDRVIADNGIFEAQSCLITLIQELS